MIKFPNLQKNTNQLNNYDVVIVFGDSNRDGVARVGDGGSVYLKSSQRAYTVSKIDQTAVNNCTLELYNPLPVTQNSHPGFGRETVYPVNYGSDCAFVDRYISQSAKPLLLIKYGIPGSTSTNWTKANNLHYNILVNFIIPFGISAMRQAGFRLPNFKCSFVNLGTNDIFISSPETTTPNNLKGIIGNIRSDLYLPSLPFYLVQVRADRPAGDVTGIRAGILSLADNTNANFTPGVAVITTYETLPLQSDGLHYTALGYDTMGINEANIALAL